jgi:hypothetical protein
VARKRQSLFKVIHDSGAEIATNPRLRREAPKQGDNQRGVRRIGGEPLDTQTNSQARTNTPEPAGSKMLHPLPRLAA